MKKWILVYLNNWLFSWVSWVVQANPNESSTLPFKNLILCDKHFTFISNLQLPELQEINACYLNHQVCGILLQQLELTKTEVKVARIQCRGLERKASQIASPGILTRPLSSLQMRADRCMHMRKHQRMKEAKRLIRE